MSPQRLDKRKHVQKRRINALAEPKRRPNHAVDRTMRAMLYNVVTSNIVS